MIDRRTWLAGILFLGLYTAAVPVAAFAQTDPLPSWTSVGILPSNTRINSASETIDPGNLYGHLTWVPFMGAAEFRNGPYGIAVDYIHAPLQAGIGTRNILFNGASAGLGLDIGSATFLYRAIAQPDQYVDVGLGSARLGAGRRYCTEPGAAAPRQRLKRACVGGSVSRRTLPSRAW
jgi:hypothetical protein